MQSKENKLLPGLYIVGTPIGNMGDMSPRAIETLRDADVVACEDTRVFGKLATKFDIKTRRIAFHDHNERELIERITDMIAGRRDSHGTPALTGTIPGASIAIVSDSGMPTISDPGFRLVRACREMGLPVFVVPGPTAVISALALSGFPTDRFTFCGFLPATDAARETALHNDNKIRHTIIYYDSPNRIMETIAACARIMPERKIAIVREITKIHEETIIGYPSEIIVGANNHSPEKSPFKGEIVLVIAPAPDVKMTDSDIAEIVNDITGGRGHAPKPTKSAASELAARTGISKKEAYGKIISDKK